MMETNIRKLVITALFAALACVATMVIRIPTIGTNGYVNIGDTIVLLCAWLIGGVYGGLAAGIGSGLADLLAGYGMYVPGTFAIKFFMAIAAYIIMTKMAKTYRNKILGYLVSGIAAEGIMTLGYFLYESTLLGYGIAAAGSILSNLIQGITCLILGYAMIGVLEGSKATSRIKKFI